MKFIFLKGRHIIMYNFPIGVILESFRLDRSASIKKAAEIGANGIQMYATQGENSPENLNAAARKELLKEVKDAGLCFSALCGDLGKGFGNPEINPELIEKSKRIVDLALDLDTKIITTHIGVVPSDKNHDRYKIMQEACYELAQYADSVGAHFAVEHLLCSRNSLILSDQQAFPLTLTPQTLQW